MKHTRTKIASRPAAPPPSCADLVTEALRAMGARRGSLETYGLGVADTMRAFKLAGTIGWYEIGEPVELVSGAYGIERWVQKVSFGSDSGPAYTTKLQYDFRRGA